MGGLLSTIYVCESIEIYLSRSIYKHSYVVRTVAGDNIPAKTFTFKYRGLFAHTFHVRI